MQLPVAGTVPRGTEFSDYEATAADAIRAGQELTSPWIERGIELDALSAAKARGRKIYSTFCLPCHGAVGNGDGPVAMHGFPPPPPLTAESSMLMSDGQMFHVLTFGQKNMPGYAAQISTEDRWKAILHVRSIQDAANRKAEAEQTAQASIEAGKQIFQRLNCHKCHSVALDEKPVGPYLGKVAQSYSRAQLYEAILHPSRTIAEGFLAQSFLMMDGTTQSGFVTGETAEQITIRDRDGSKIILPVSEIDERRTLDKSPMPDGIIKDLADDELESLLDYLKSIPAEPASDKQTDAQSTNPADGEEENIPNKLREPK